MDVPLNAEVRCKGQPCGESVALIVHPNTQKVTHVVVKEKRFPHVQHLVPIDRVVEATPQRIELGCILAELAKMDPFIEEEFIRVEVPQYVTGGVYSHPVVTAGSVPRTVLVEHEHVPRGELAVHRGAKVRATDGHIGRVDEFRVDDEDHITHLVLREGHLWGKKEIAIPLSEVDCVEQDEVCLKLSKAEVEPLVIEP